MRKALLAAALTALVGAPAAAPAALIQTFQMSGNLGLEVAADDAGPGGALPSVSGTFVVTNMPPGAITQKAIVYTNDWASSGSLDLVFNSFSVGLTGPFQSDTSSIITHLFAYQWDVTNLVQSPGSYSFAIGQGSQGNQIYGAALAVVWQDPLAPVTTVSIIDGARQVGENLPDTESASYTNLPAGPTTLWIFTVADDAVGSGEVVRYNSNAVGGPIDENLGMGASLLQISTTSVAGTNGVSISTSADHFGWLLAASSVVIPEPSTGLLLVFGLAALAIGRRRWASSVTAPRWS